MSATMSLGCHEDATRKLLPWNLSRNASPIDFDVAVNFDEIKFPKRRPQNVRCSMLGAAWHHIVYLTSLRFRLVRSGIIYTSRSFAPAVFAPHQNSPFRACWAQQSMLFQSTINTYSSNMVGSMLVFCNVVKSLCKCWRSEKLALQAC